MHELKKTFLFALIGFPLVTLSNHIVSNPLPSVGYDYENPGSAFVIHDTPTQRTESNQTSSNY